MTTPEILFLAHRIPYPPDKGDKIRSWRLLHHLYKRFDVHLVCFVDDPKDFAHEEFLATHCASVHCVSLDPFQAKLKSLSALASNKPLSFRYFDDRQFRNAVAKLRARPLVAEIAFSSSMAPFIERPVGDRKRLVDFCDADSEKWYQYSKTARWPLSWVYHREGRALANAETDIANWADASFAVTPDESELFNRRPDANATVDWWVNGVDTEYFDPLAISHNEACKSDVVFVGAMDYRANIDGVLSFTQDVWPKIRQAKPQSTFAIVGSNPAAEISALDGNNGIHVTGRVADVRPWLAEAGLVIAPLSVARGIQNKVLEAMAMGKTVVASKEAMTGINAPSECAVVTNDANAMATAIINALDQPEQYESIGHNARRFVIDTLSWDAGLARFDNALHDLGL